jgi:hypothetical protein
MIVNRGWRRTLLLLDAVLGFQQFPLRHQFVNTSTRFCGFGLCSDFGNICFYGQSSDVQSDRVVELA